MCSEPHAPQHMAWDAKARPAACSLCPCVVRLLACTPTHTALLLAQITATYRLMRSACLLPSPCLLSGKSKSHHSSTSTMEDTGFRPSRPESPAGLKVRQKHVRCVDGVTTNLLTQQAQHCQCPALLCTRMHRPRPPAPSRLRWRTTT